MPRNPKRSPAEPKSKEQSAMGEWSKHAGFGIQYAVTIGIFAFGGFKLDEWLDSEPIGLLIAVFAGFVGATVSLVKKLPSTVPASSSSKSKPGPGDKSQ
jgi:F0F1-type ATP synthase assembly protein I